MLCSPFTEEQKEELLSDYREKFDVYRRMLSFSPKNILDMIMDEVDTCKVGLSEEDCEAEHKLRESIIYDILGITDEDIPDATFDFNPVSLGIVLNNSNRILDYTVNLHISADQASFDKIRATFNKMYDNIVNILGEFLESGKLPFEIEGMTQVPVEVLLEEEGTLMMMKAAYESFLEELDFRNYMYVINESENEHIVGVYLKELIKDTLEVFETSFKDRFLEIASTYGEMDQEDIDRFLERTSMFGDILEILNMEYGSKSTGELMNELMDLLQNGYSGGTSSPDGPTTMNIGMIGLAFEFANVLIENYGVPRFPELTKADLTFEDVVETVGHMGKDLLMGEWDYLVDTLDTLGAKFPKCDEGYGFVNLGYFHVNQTEESTSDAMRYFLNHMSTDSREWEVNKRRQIMNTYYDNADQRAVFFRTVSNVDDAFSSNGDFLNHWYFDHNFFNGDYGPEKHFDKAIGTDSYRPDAATNMPFNNDGGFFRGWYESSVDAGFVASDGLRYRFE